MVGRPLALTLPLASDRAALWQIAGRALAIALNVATLTILVRELGPVGYGYVALAHAVVGGLGTLANPGLDQLLLRRLSRAPDDGRAFAETAALRLVLAAGIAVLLAVGALVAVRGEELRPALLAAAAGVAVTGLLVFQQPLRAQLRLKALASADVGGSVLVLALVVALSLGELRAWEVVLVMAAANGVCWLALAAYAVHRVAVPSIVPSPADWRAQIATGLPLGIGALLVFAYFRTDVMILSASAGAAATGVYAAAYRLVDIGLYAPNIFVGARFPALARQWDDPGQRHALLHDAARQLVRLAGIAGVAGVLLGPKVLEIIGGSRFGGEDVVVGILSVALALMCLNALLVQSLLAAGALGDQLRAYIAATGAMVAIGVPLIIVAGAPGAAGATLATEVVLCAVAAALLRRKAGWLPPIRWLGLLALALAAAGAVAGLNRSLGVDVPVAAALAAVVWMGVRR